jgi:molybdate transport system substrate-binding protein
MRRRVFWIGLLGSLAALISSRLPAQERTITVFAAASLANAFSAMQGEFERANPGTKVRFNYAASSLLRTQIEQGAPADVFAPADYAQMRPLEAARLVAAPRTFARNRLVVAVPASNPARLRSVRDLARKGLRLAATGEAVPIGRYTQEVLKKLSATRGYPRDFAARVNANVVSREANVRSVLTKVELGEADAAIVYETDTRVSRRVRSLPIPEAANVLTEYPIAPVLRTPDRARADAFVRFVLSPRGRAILKRHGFR